MSLTARKECEPRTFAILAGGKSSRFGADKALAPWFDGNIMDAIISALKPLSGDLIIVANRSEPYKYLGIPITKDEIMDSGPMAGLLSCLRHAKGDRVFVAACDMPLLKSELIDWMWNINTWAPVIIPKTPEGLEPLHAIYHRSLTPLIENSIRHNRLGLQGFINDLPRYEVQPEDIARFCPDFSCLASANKNPFLPQRSQSAQRKSL